MVQVANYHSVVGGVFNLCPSKKKEEDHVILNSDLEKLTLILSQCCCSSSFVLLFIIMKLMLIKSHYLWPIPASQRVNDQVRFNQT